MTTLRVAVVQVGYGDDESVADRIARVSDLVRQACADRELDLVLLPELWAPSGFAYEGWEAAAEPIDGPWATAMAALAAEVGVTLHAGSFVERLPEAGAEGRSLANTSLLVGADGEVLATYRKVHRFGFGNGEPVLMEAGDQIVVVDLPLADGTSVRTGLATCYDLRFPEQFRLLLDAGAEVLLVPAAWPMPRVGHWRLLGRARALENQSVVIQCNTAGTHHQTQMGGHSQVVAADGEVLAELAHGDEAVLHAEIDLSRTADYRDAFPVLADRRL